MLFAQITFSQNVSILYLMRTKGQPMYVSPKPY